MDIEERAIRIAQYIVENNATIRAAAKSSRWERPRLMMI